MGSAISKSPLRSKGAVEKAISMRRELKLGEASAAESSTTCLASSSFPGAMETSRCLPSLLGESFTSPPKADGSRPSIETRTREVAIGFLASLRVTKMLSGVSTSLPRLSCADASTASPATLIASTTGASASGNCSQSGLLSRITVAARASCGCENETVSPCLSTVSFFHSPAEVRYVGALTVCSPAMVTFTGTFEDIVMGCMVYLSAPNATAAISPNATRHRIMHTVLVIRSQPPDGLCLGKNRHHWQCARRYCCLASILISSK